MESDQQKSKRRQWLRILLLPGAAFLVPIILLETVARVDLGFWMSLGVATHAGLMMLGTVGACLAYLVIRNDRATSVGYALGAACGGLYLVFSLRHVLLNR